MSLEPIGGEDFDGFFHSVYPQARALAYRILGNRPAAEDAAAEAFTRALASWRRIGGLSYRDAWVLRVTANVAIDMQRRGRSWGATTDPIIDPAEATVVRLALAEAVSALPRRQREVIVLRYLVG